VPTAERTLDPARMFDEELDPWPGIREQPGSYAGMGSVCPTRLLYAREAAKIVRCGVYEGLTVVPKKLSPSARAMRDGAHLAQGPVKWRALLC
jgi:hypothetical protein